MFSNNYNQLLNNFEKNKNKKWNEWLYFDSLVGAQGKQGVVGLIKSKEDDNVQYIFKMSQNINYLAYHELIIMQGLNTITNFCPNFCKGIGLIKTNVEPIHSISNPNILLKKKYYCVNI